MIRNSRQKIYVGDPPPPRARAQITLFLDMPSPGLFFSQTFLRFHSLRSVKLGEWLAGTSILGLHRRQIDATPTLN